MDTSIYLGGNIRYLRELNHISRKRLAVDLDYKSQSTIEKWENEVSSPPMEALVGLSKYFNVSVDDLLFRDLSDQPVPPEKVMIKYSAASDEIKDAVCKLLKIGQSC